MTTFKKFVLVYLLALSWVGFLVAGCGGGGSSSTPAPAAASGTMISGKVTAPGGSVGARSAGLTGTSAVSGVTVSLYSYNSSKVESIVAGVSAVTNSSGNYTLTVPAGTSLSSSIFVSVGTGANRMRALAYKASLDIDPVSEITVRKIVASTNALSAFSSSEITAIHDAINTAAANVAAGADVSATLTAVATAADAAASVTAAVSAANQAPTANAGSDQSVTAGGLVTLDGRSSSDPEGISVTYLWSQVSGTTVTLSSSSAAQPTFTPAAAGTFVFSLTVNDGIAGSAANTVTITAAAQPVNNAPTANAGADQNVTAGSLATLNGSASSDLDSDSLTYSWSQVSGTTVTLSSVSAAQPTFTPAAAGTYVFSLTVNDGKVNSAADTVTITVAARTPQTVDVSYTANGFSPATLTIFSGDSVRWTNNSGGLMQLAEGTHPIHTDCTYCPQGTSVGATVSISNGSSSTFQFNGAGTANIHNHLSPAHTSVITVQ